MNSFHTVEIPVYDCSASSANYFFQYIGVDAVEFTDVVVYPNPATHVLYVQGVADYTTYCIYDLTGRKIMEGRPAASFDIASLSNGIYTIQLQNGEKTTVLRFEKMQ